MMKLWLLEAIRERSPWVPWYDTCFGLVVRAETEVEARAIASENGGEEIKSGAEPWMHEEYSTCIELTGDGDRGVIIRDIAEA